MLLHITDLDIQVDDEIIHWILWITEYSIKEDRPHLQGLKGTDLARANDWLLWVSPSKDVHPCLLHHCKQVRIVLCLKQN